MAGLIERASLLRSLRALATVYYWGTDGRGSFQEAVLVLRPDRLRLETLSPLGAVSIVTVDGGEARIHHPKEGVFYRGKSSRENLFRYTQIPLGLDDLTSILMGLPPIGKASDWVGAGNSISKEIEGGGREFVTFDHVGLPIKWERADPLGRIELAALFSDFSPTPAGLFPFTIALEDRLLERRLEIRYEGPEVNAPLPLALFTQEKPANAREIPLEALDAR